eukprot:NODE_12415_length_512_cov_30.601542_g12125_i0.p1 GENE.NODE_12415_length_512_cov_30.601542_g12125_i0~~NODE_12415_length_512_cov_30.601542_g12125_i0.p1  ORF type:complete len:162 (+),score=47.12 NODE_12415_length_512_cov_30.601542_g12125_i0:25-510(+)
MYSGINAEYMGDDWTPYSDCSATCGTGDKTRTRKVLRKTDYGGKACGTTTETVNCNTDPCPQDCVMSDWGEFQECSATCARGTQIAQRSIKVPQAYGGKACDASQKSQYCNTQNCPIDCVMGEYSTWSDCSLTCGGGQQTRTRKIQVAADYGAKPCPCTLR